jgi:dynein heavy chain
MLRTGSEVDTGRDNGPDLIFGEVHRSPLAGLQDMLSSVCKPLLQSQQMWGKADTTQSGEFMSEMGKFTNVLGEALKHIVGGVELKKPEPQFIEMYDSNPDAPFPEVIQHFEGLLSAWCTEVDKCVTGKNEKKANTETSGLLEELEHWRSRMQRLTSITEQLKTRNCKVVIGCLSAYTKNVEDPSRQKVFNGLRAWKQIDISLTEAANEAKDNAKYLSTLDRFVEPLTNGEPSTVVDTIPAMMNSIKMIHTIARYYNTEEKMTSLFMRITNLMIENSKKCILAGQPNASKLWEQDPEELVRNLESCLKLNDAYKEQYLITKVMLQKSPKGQQFDFDEQKIFAKFENFCRRIIKLIDMFSTIHQFSSLTGHSLEGMESLIDLFENIVRRFKMKRHDLLDFQNSKFDRDYVEFNVNISDLEGLLQNFINESFESIRSIELSLQLLTKFQQILQRESLKSDLDSKLSVIFQNYALELAEVHSLYEKQKLKPPIPRNLPPVAGNITWSRHMLKRIEEPMKKFETNQNVLASQDAKKIIRVYNKVARMLVAFEYLWYQAWVQSIDQAKTGLQATLIVRHPHDGKLYVNFDQEIMQMMREAKCLERMNIDIPTEARIVLLQQNKFKAYFGELQFALIEYERVLTRVIPVTAQLLTPQFNDMEFKIRPGMVTLTWTSMNIDAYRDHVQNALQKLDELITNINDILENRVEKNLKVNTYVYRSKIAYVSTIYHCG